jgi:hypothetical protein
MDGRVRVQFAILTNPGSKACRAQCADQRFQIIPKYCVGSLAQDREVDRASARMRAKGGRQGIRVAALGDGRPDDLQFAAVQLLGMSQHCKGPLVDRRSVNLDTRVILWRLLTAGRFRRLRSGLRWDRCKSWSQSQRRRDERLGGSGCNGRSE